MKIANLWLIITFLLVTGCVEAKQTAKTEYSPSETNIVNLGPGCRIKIDLPSNGVVTQSYLAEPSRSTGGGKMTLIVKLPGFRNAQETLGLSCFYSESEAVTNRLVVRDTASGQWRLTDEQRMYYGMTAGVPPLYTVESVNADGWAVRYAGEGEFPELVLDFCLFHGQRAICGSFGVGWEKRSIRRLGNGSYQTIYRPVVDHSPYALQLLRSVQFIDDVPQNTENERAPQ